MCIADKKSSQKGFSLMEMLVVVAILVIIAAIASPFAVRTLRSLRQQELDSKARMIYIAAQNRVTELRASGRQQIYTDTANSKPASGEAMRYVASYDGSTDAFGIFGADLVGYEIWEKNWVIVFDSRSGNIKEVFYSEGDLDYDPNTFDSFRDYNNRLKSGAKNGYYGGDTLDIGVTSALYPRITIENGEELIAHLSCESPDSSPLTFDVTVTDSDGVSVTETVAPDIFGTKCSYDMVLDSLKDGCHFKEAFPALKAGSDISIELKVRSTDTFIDDGVAKANTNSLFASLDGDTAVITACRHLQNLDLATSGVGDFVKNAVQKSSLWFSDTVSDSDWFDTYGAKGFKPIVNQNLASYNGSYTAVKSVNVDGAEKLKEEIAATVIYNLNIKADQSEDAGLFQIVAAEQELSLKNIYLCNASVTAEYSSTNSLDSCNAGALVGRMGDSSGAYVKLSIDGCRVYLDKTKAAISDSAYIDGNCVGGLVGAALSGELRITDSFAATVIGQSGKTAVGGGLVGSAANIKTDIERSYADCYINAQRAGGLIGSTFNSAGGAEISLNRCYAAGYLNAVSANSQIDGGSVAAAGLVCGEVSRSADAYTVCSINAPKDADYYTTFMELRTAGGTGNVLNTYFMEKRVVDELPDIPNTEQKTYPVLSNADGYGSLFSSAGFTGANGGVNSNAYNLRDQGLTDYSYPRLTGLPHYGDWRADFETGALVYYEEYSDGRFGFYGANTDTLINDVSIVGDGYAIVFADTSLAVMGASISLDDGSDSYVKFDNTNKKVISSADGDEYIIYTLPTTVSDYDSISNGFYCKCKLDVEGVVKYYYFNPQFAKCVSEGDESGTAPEPPLAIYIRTARHLNGLSKCCDTIMSDVMDSTFVQEADISYLDYKWTSYTNSGKPTEQKPVGGRSVPFGAAYNGYKHIIKLDIPVKDSEYIGLFGVNSGSIEDVYLTFEGVGIEHIADSVSAVGSFVGENDGSITGCLVYGADISASASYGASLTVGGFAGRNTSNGIITHSTVQIEKMSLKAGTASVLYAGGFVGENSGRISECTALSCIDVENNSGDALAAGFGAINNGEIKGCTCASALIPKDYVGIYGFASDSYGGITNSCRFLDGGIYCYGDAVCPYKYQDSCGAARISYDALAAEQIELMDNHPDGKVSFGDWIEKPDIGSVGLFYWERCASGCHVSFIGSHDGEGRFGSYLCESESCPSVTQSGYGFYARSGASLDVAEAYSAADTDIADKLMSMIGENGFSAYVFGGSPSRNVEIKYNSGDCAFGYEFEVDSRFADSFRYVKMIVYKNGSRRLDILPSADEITSFGGRDESFFDRGYKVRTVSQLQNISEEPNGSFDVSHNIDGNNAVFAPICGNTLPFSGTFNGGGYTIRKLYISSDSYNAGLFGRTENAAISNVTLLDSLCMPSAGGSIGSIVGYAEGGSITNCCGNMRVNISGYGSVTFGGILGSGSAYVSDCIGLSRMVGNDYGFGSRFYAISGGSSPVVNCYALDIISGEALDVFMGYGVTLLNWDEMRNRLREIPNDYPKGAVYWNEAENIITNKVAEPNYVSIRTAGNISDWRFRIVSADGQPVEGVIVSYLGDAVSVTVTPEYDQVAGEYKLIAYTGDGAAQECRLVILPDVAG